MSAEFGEFVETCREYGIRRTEAYRLAAAGLIETFHIGTKRYVVRSSLKSLPDKLRRSGKTPCHPSPVNKNVRAGYPAFIGTAASKALSREFGSPDNLRAAVRRDGFGVLNDIYGIGKLSIARIKQWLSDEWNTNENR